MGKKAPLNSRFGGNHSQGSHLELMGHLLHQRFPRCQQMIHCIENLKHTLPPTIRNFEGELSGQTLVIEVRSEIFTWAEAIPSSFPASHAKIGGECLHRLQVLMPLQCVIRGARRAA
jgi:hypothetical protein